MSSIDMLRSEIAAWTGVDPIPDADAAREAVRRLLAALSRGEVRAAERTSQGWRAVRWVKEGILLAFRAGTTAPVAGPGGISGFFDRDTLPLRHTDGVAERVRVVPGGSSVRAGAYLGPGVVIMPPAYVNVGAYVGGGTMIDSHALVGSCAQVGRNVHLSAGAQLGGVLEPVGLRPVIIEDEALVGGNTGVFEGTLVEKRAVIAPGVNLTASVPVFDLVRDEIYRAGVEEPLTIPAGAVVVPGARRVRGSFPEAHGVHLQAPVIVKYRDGRTDAATALESALRE